MLIAAVCNTRRIASPPLPRWLCEEDRTLHWDAKNGRKKRAPWAPERAPLPRTVSRSIVQETRRFIAETFTEPMCEFSDMVCQNSTEHALSAISVSAPHAPANGTNALAGAYGAHTRVQTSYRRIQVLQLCVQCIGMAPASICSGGTTARSVASSYARWIAKLNLG